VVTREDVDQLVEACVGDDRGEMWRVGRIVFAPIWLGLFDETAISLRLGYPLDEVRAVTARLRGQGIWCLNEMRHEAIALDVTDPADMGFLVGASVAILVGAGQAVRIPAPV
jgi:hypothetical protein